MPRRSQRQDTIVETAQDDYSSQLSIIQHTRYRSDITWFSDRRPRPNWPRNQNAAPNAEKSSAPRCAASVATKSRSDPAPVLVELRNQLSIGRWLRNLHCETVAAAITRFPGLLLMLTSQSAAVQPSAIPKGSSRGEVTATLKRPLLLIASVLVVINRPGE